MAKYGFILSDTITVKRGYACILDVNDTTGKTVTTTSSADQIGIFIAEEDGGSATATANATMTPILFDGPESVDVVAATTVTIAGLAATSTTAGKVGTCTGAAGDYAIGFFGASATVNKLVRVYLAPHHVGATS